MKRFLFIAALAACLCWACTDELQPLEPAPIAGTGSQVVTLSVGVESQSDASKATFLNDGTFKWQDGDQIGVYLYSTLSGTSYGPWIAPFDLQRGAGTGTGVFARQLDGALGECYGNVAIYPYTVDKDSDPWQMSSYAYADDATKGRLTFFLPSVYKDLDNLEMVRMPMAAVLNMEPGGDKTSFQLKHVGGAVKFTLKNVPAKAKYFKLWAVGKNISGFYSINLSDIGTGTLQGDGSGNTVELQLKEGQAKETLDVYFPVPAGSYKLGIGVYGDGIVYLEKTASKENAIGRGQILRMPEVTIPAPNLGAYNPDLPYASKASGITYQMNVYSFKDSDGDGIGDFPGIVSELDYLDKLGVTAIWLSPSQLAQSYHGYDVKDYTSLNPDYAGGGVSNHTAEKADEAFQDLIDQAHAHNIRIYMDYVINHTGDQHPWFLDVKDKGTASPYWNYYCISQDPGTDISAGNIPQIPSSGSYVGDWHPLLIGAGKTTVRYAFDLDWTNSQAPTLTVTDATGQTLTSENAPHNNPPRYLRWGSTTTQFADNGENQYRLVLDYCSDWGCLVRTTTANDWSSGTKWGFNGTYQLKLGSSYQLYTGASDDVKNILMPDGTMYYYHSAFYTGMMPDINYGWANDCENSDTFKAIVATTDKWLNMGLDGLRLDAVKHVYNTTEDNVRFWQQFYNAVDAKYVANASNSHRTNLVGTKDSHIFMVGEVLDGASTCLSYYKGLPAIFDFQFWWDLREVLKNDSKGSFVTNLEQRYRYDIYNQRSGWAVSSILTPKLSNHDEDRTATELYEMHRIRQAAAVLLTVPGRPFIYQGEELGYWGNKSNGDEYVRAPILWTSDISSAAVAGVHNKYDSSMLTEERSVVTQAADKESLLTLYRHFAYARNTNPAMANGWIEADNKTNTNNENCSFNDKILAWYMHEPVENGKVCLVMHNISGSTQTVQRWDGDNVSDKTILVASDPISISNENGKWVTMPPYSSVVFALN